MGKAPFWRAFSPPSPAEKLMLNHVQYWTMACNDARMMANIPECIPLKYIPVKKLLSAAGLSSLTQIHKSCWHSQAKWICFTVIRFHCQGTQTLSPRGTVRDFSKSQKWLKLNLIHIHTHTNPVRWCIVLRGKHFQVLFPTGADNFPAWGKNNLGQAAHLPYKPDIT